jgi:hypothetical protein
MIISILTYKLPTRWTLEQAVAMFKTTAPLYLGKPGLLRKHYCMTEAGEVKGIYLWKSKAHAEACFTPEWTAMVAAKYGAAPEIVYGVVPVTVDNLQEAIEVE